MPQNDYYTLFMKKLLLFTGISHFQASSGNAVGSIGVGPVGNPRGVPRPMPMVGMQRMPAPGMTAYGIPSQADISGMNPGGIPMQRAAAAQAAHQQVSDVNESATY